MQISRIKDENGENKEFLHKWPTRERKFNWLMFSSGFGEQAMVTYYLISGNPTEEDLSSQMKEFAKIKESESS